MSIFTEQINARANLELLYARLAAKPNSPLHFTEPDPQPISIVAAIQGRQSSFAFTEDGQEITKHFSGHAIILLVDGQYRVIPQSSAFPFLLTVDDANQIFPNMHAPIQNALSRNTHDRRLRYAPVPPIA